MAEGKLRAEIIRLAFRAGWRWGPHLPDRMLRSLQDSAGLIATLGFRASLDQLADNLRQATNVPVDRKLLRAAVSSYARYLLEIFALPGWSRDRILEQVSTTGERELRTAFDTNGAVIALPHSGNWDLAGAWGCLSGLPVTTVAERLAPKEFAQYTRLREGLGMRVLPHDHPGILAELCTDVRRGRVASLVADRDLAQSGLKVSWKGNEVTMPAGPALVARRTSASLFAAVCHYTSSGMHISISPPVPALPGRDGLVEMTQRLADTFAAAIAARPEDWHMFQPFFAAPKRVVA